MKKPCDCPSWRNHIIPENPVYRREGERIRRLKGMLRVARNRRDGLEVNRILALLEQRAEPAK